MNDDDEPIIQNWLTNFAEKVRRQTRYSLRLWRGFLVLIDEAMPTPNSIVLPSIQTRGQLRKLAELLGAKP